MVFYGKVKMGLCKILFCSLFGVFLVLSGCGENLFKGLAMQEDGTDLASLSGQLGMATSKEDFSKIASNAKAIIESSEASDSEKQEANLVYAQAVMGANDITAINVMQDLVNLLSSGSSGNGISGSSFSEEEDKNLFNAFSSLMASASSSDIRVGSKAFNDAHDYSVADTSLRKLLDQEQLVRAICNLLTVVNIVDRDFIIKQDSVEPRNKEASVASLIINVMKPDGESGNTLDYYSTNGISALEASGSLSKKQVIELKKLDTITDRFKLLHQAVIDDSNTATGEYEPKVGPRIAVGGGHSLSPQDRDANIIDALSDVFEGV